MSTERAEASLPVMPYTAASFSIIGTMRLSTVTTLNLRPIIAAIPIAVCIGPSTGMLTHSRAPNRPGSPMQSITTASAPSRSASMTRAIVPGSRQHDLVVALDRGGARFDVDEINLHAVGLKLRCVLGRAEALCGNRRDNADVNGHGKPPLLCPAANPRSKLPPGDASCRDRRQGLRGTSPDDRAILASSIGVLAARKSPNRVSGRDLSFAGKIWLSRTCAGARR